MNRKNGVAPNSSRADSSVSGPSIRAAIHPKRMNVTAERSGFTSQGKPAATPRDRKTGQPGKAFAKYRPFCVSMTKPRALKDSGWGGAGTQSLPEAKILA